MTEAQLGIFKVNRAKKFKLAVLTGRYQNLQNSHVDNIVLASALADEVLVVVGSAQEEGTQRNPFPAGFRASALQEAIERKNLHNVRVVCLNDYTNENDICFEWGKYLLEFIVAVTGQKPDLMIHGDDGRAADPILWFSEEDKVGIHFLIVPRNGDSISGTKARNLLVLNDYNAWSQDVPPTLHRHYMYMRGYLLSIPFYQEALKLINAMEGEQ